MARTVLLVDDDPAVRVVASAALARVGGWHVVEAGSGDAALAAAREHAPDVILLDVQMPTMDGPATLAAIRAIPAALDVPVVFLTADGEGGRCEELRRLGVAGLLTKPFDPMTLSSQLAEIVGFGA